MRIVVTKTAQEFERTMALLIAAEIAAKPDLNLGMATGTTTAGIHRELVNLYREGLISFKRVHTFNLDVRHGLPLGHVDSGYLPMKTQLFDYMDIPIENGCFPDSGNPDAQAAITAYVQKIDELGGLDVQVLPFGENGHVGFCQPGTKFAASAVVCRLPEEYILPLCEKYGGADKVPSIGLSMGPADIMHARRLFFCAKGLRKAKIVAAALKGPVTEDVPASIVQMHPNVIAVFDEEAASLL